MGDKFCLVIVSTFSSAGPVWRNIKMEKAGYCLDQLFVSWIKFSEDGLHVGAIYYYSLVNSLVNGWMDYSKDLPLYLEYSVSILH